MIQRTFGWIQDPGKLEHLRRVVEVFDPSSRVHMDLKNVLLPKLVTRADGQIRLIKALKKRPLEISYSDLVGTAFSPRPSARCNAIIQAVIPGQKRPFISDWPADNFIRWAQALGLVKWNRSRDTFSITKLGELLSNSEKQSDQEYSIFERAFLSYPPVSRVINLLVEAAKVSQAMTKFEIGKQLGFKGEKGFTNISQELFVKEISQAAAKDKKKIRSNWEGDSDKYARMICSWLFQLKYPWVAKTKKTVTATFGGNRFFYDLQAFTVTPRGFEIRKRLTGESKFKKIKKLVNFEMLCTKGRDRNYLRSRRANVLQLMNKSPLSIVQINSKLRAKGFDEDPSNIKADISGLINIGLLVIFSNNKFRCIDDITGLSIPKLQVVETRKSDILELTEKCRRVLKVLPHEFLILIDLGFDSKQSLYFEIKTIELLTEHCGFEGMHLGKSKRPDGIIYNDSFGIIIDNKAYVDGFAITAPERDKMKRYIEENRKRDAILNATKWWEFFPSYLDNFLFLFISGSFKGNLKQQLQILSRSTDGTLGSAISSYMLLMFAEMIMNKTMSHEEFKTKIGCLEEVKA